jgi:HEAT repeat protein
MKKTALLLLVILAVVGCRSAVRKEVDETKMLRVHLEPVHATLEMQAEISGLLDRLQTISEIVTKDELKGKLGQTIDRLVEIGQPSVVPLVDAYYDAIERPYTNEFRYLVLAVLDRVREVRTLPFLMQVLAKGDRKERRLAAAAIWRFGDTTCVKALIAALEDDDQDVIDTSAAALRAITGYSFGLSRNISEEQRSEAIIRWRQWYDVMGSALAGGRADRF